MKIYELPNGEWTTQPKLSAGSLRQINPDLNVAHRIELDSCTAVITAHSCYFRDAAAPVITLEEMQRVTKCMEMLAQANQTS